MNPSTWPMIEQAPSWPSEKNGVPNFHVVQVLGHLPSIWVIRVCVFEVDLENKAAWFLQPQT